MVSLIYSTLKGPLGLDPKPSKKSDRTAKQYREEKRRKKIKAEPHFNSSGFNSPGDFSLSDGMRKGQRGKGLTSQTIMEEMDSDY